MEYKQTETETPEPMVGDLDKYIEWDTDDVQDRSCTLSPTTIIDKPMQGESVEETLPARQNIHLVSERLIKPGVVQPQEHMPVMEEKDTPQDDSAPMDKEQANLMADNDIVELFTGMEDL